MSKEMLMIIVKLIAIVVVVLIIIVSIINIYNILIEKNKKVERNNSLVDIYSKKRYDLIPNLIEVCKGYSKHEKETLEKVARLRLSLNDNPTDTTREKLDEVYKNLVALAESYSEIKASDNYLRLQKELTNVENELQASRRIYINSITDYNNTIIKFPILLFAKIFGFKKKELPKYDYNYVKVNFNKNKE